MRPLTIRVTQRHIKKGKSNKPKSCPIALALKERFHRPVKVGADKVEVNYDYGQIVYYLPDEATQFVYNFDGGYKVKPFSFQLIRE
jgi:hypothetical protein